MKLMQLWTGPTKVDVKYVVIIGKLLWLVYENRTYCMTPNFVALTFKKYNLQ